MTGISRRSFLKQAPVAAIAISAPAVAAASDKSSAAPIEKPEDEISRLADELLTKMHALHGDGCKLIRGERGAFFFLPPPEPVRIVEFTGPGWYEVEDGSPERVEVMWLQVDTRFPKHPRNGRFLKATPKREDLHSRHYEEIWLRQIIVRKIGGAS